MNDIVASERLVLGTIIETNGDSPLPLSIVQLLNNSPEAFGDQRHKQISSALVGLKNANKAVHTLSVLERLDFEGAQTYLMQVASSAMSLDIAEREADAIWQGFRERQTTSILAEGFEAITSTPQMTRAIAANVRKALARLDDDYFKDGLPEITDASQLVSTSPILPMEIIKGLLHAGSKLSLGGDSKAGKSWVFLDMAVSLASGSNWLGLETERTRVLYVNLEIQPEFLHKRMETLCLARLIFPEPGWLDVWNLRGFSAPHDILIPKIIKRAKERGYGAIIIDPSYKLFSADSDENSATDVNAVMKSFEQITLDTRASVLFGAHFAKGNSSAKEAIDRVSGSGVWARDPDCIVTFTRHKRDDSFTVQTILRNLPPLDPFVVEWVYPRFQRIEGVDPEDLKPARTGRPPKWKIEMIMETLGDKRLKTGEWKKLTADETGMPKASFLELVREAKDNAWIVKSQGEDYWRVSAAYSLIKNNSESDKSE